MCSYYTLILAKRPETSAIFFFFFFFMEEKCMTWLESLKTSTFLCRPLFRPHDSPWVGVLKSQNRTSTHLGSVPGRVPTVLPLRVPGRVRSFFGVSYMQYIQLGSLGRLYMQYTQLGSLPLRDKGIPPGRF